MISPIYRAQVALLLRVLPYVAREQVFALKGGTAINLFERALPRLSVDIDLTYLPIEGREEALTGITAGLKAIRKRLLSSIPNIQVDLLPQSDGREAKLGCMLDGTQIKIEVNTTIRGYLQEPRLMSVANAVQDEFGLFAAIKVVSQGELFGGKLCAALDRQHPRDLFDVHFLLENGGIDEPIKLGFIAALLGHSKPIHEMLRPQFKDQQAAFANQFSGMTTQPFSYRDFEETRQRLVKELHRVLTEADRRFIISFKSGKPDWGLYPLLGLEQMSAVKWKLHNIHKLLNGNPDKHAQQFAALCDCLAHG